MMHPHCPQYLGCPENPCPCYEADVAEGMKCRCGYCPWCDERMRGEFNDKVKALISAIRHCQSKAMFSITDHHDRAAYEALEKALKELE